MGVVFIFGIILEDRQLAVLEAHVMMMTRRLANTHWWGQATVAKAEAVRRQTKINQKVAGKMFKIKLALSNILNIIKENSDLHRGSGCGGRSRGQRFEAATKVTIASAANSSNSGGRHRLLLAMHHMQASEFAYVGAGIGGRLENTKELKVMNYNGPDGVHWKAGVENGYQ